MNPRQMEIAEQDRAMRAEHWAYRMEQLLSGTDRRPYWQFRAADDGRDPPDCQKHHGRIERFDANFWKEQSPVDCKRLDCRCTIRAYALRDLTADLKTPLQRA